MASLALAAYRFLSPLQPFLLRLLASRKPRLKTFVEARADLFEELESRLNALPEPLCRLWIHASSVGEFEQARTIIAELREQIPEMDVVVSFFSDSGYETRKHYPDAAAVFYLPLDTPENARQLAALVGADIFMLMRYDFWPNHLEAIKRSGARMLLAAAALPAGSPYLKRGLRGFYRTIFSLFDVIFTIDENDAETFRKRFGCTSVRQAGDPRFDQVLQRQKKSDERAARLKPLFRDRMTLVGGSTWEPDEAILIPAWLALRQLLSLVLVPHKVDRENIERLLENLRERDIESVTISTLDGNFDPATQVLVVDQTGYLAELYAIASIAYVGGGFGVNVHNTIEPAVHGIPVLFGPRHGNSPEATGLIEAGAATVVTEEPELRQALTAFVDDAAHLERTGDIAGAYVRSRLGATGIIANAIAEYCGRR
ncbi:3-deoxy-D-manno-octulosonic acid transferase [Chlorobaculum limnaeum]|uniref:3-deoxy-D-manno-octulosonic acid transferase n=1 Tax=Chlorobaculum limnaeum TaxID=274537 RepID=A0A1D8CYV7_CHLLM|nr:glycosyltransferase N-terminal domain-containing protein [Chlorobaculum limnaeum]AOS84090.1 3-deoxy-D-manno-octulosonic acid transferase [Chlorobaculum limnaeum]